MLFGRAESGDTYKSKTNNPWLTHAVVGPQDVNYNWYSGWQGGDQIVVMPRRHALASLIPLAM